MTTAVLFLVSPVLVPVIELIPPEVEAQIPQKQINHALNRDLFFIMFSVFLQATAPCLVLVGSMMMGPASWLSGTRTPDSQWFFPRGQRHRLRRFAHRPAGLPHDLHHTPGVFWLSVF